MMRPWKFACGLALAAVLAGCDRPGADPRPVLRESMKGLAGYPQSSVVSMTAGADAGQMVLSTLDSVAQVAAWYRQFLKVNGWELENDQQASDGSVALYAEKGKRPIWITLRPNVGGPGTNYTIISGVVDTSTSKHAPLGSPQGNRHPTAH